MIPLFVSYVLYFLIIPGAFILTFWKMWDETVFVEYFKERKTTQIEKTNKIIRMETDLISKLKIYMVIFLIVFLPMWGFVASEISHSEMRREVHGVGFGAYVKDPVMQSLGPSYDTDSIIEEMREKPEVWFPDMIDGVVDFDELTRLPGRLSVYKMYEERYVVTYTYTTPVPMIKSYGVEMIETQEGGYKIISVEEKMIVFPLNPGSSSEVVPKTAF